LYVEEAASMVYNPEESTALLEIPNNPVELPLGMPKPTVGPLLILALREKPGEIGAEIVIAPWKILTMPEPTKSRLFDILPKAGFSLAKVSPLTLSVPPVVEETTLPPTSRMSTTTAAEESLENATNEAKHATIQNKRDMDDTFF
jgi:hypothetical protein